MKRTIAAAATACAAAFSAAGAETPTMGWSSWNTYRVNISGPLIVKQARLMKELGLADAGYKYVNIDDGYFGGREENGRLKTHPEKFPDGLKGIVDEIHSLGLKAGIYSDGGENTCGSIWDDDSYGVGVGFWGHEAEDADFFFRENGFDFIKIDFCGGMSTGRNGHYGNTARVNMDPRERYTAVRRAIDAVKKGVRINVCRWDYPGTWVREIGSSWRISGDINPTWGSVKGIIRQSMWLHPYAAPGAYNDMDMLEIGRGLSAEEDHTHFAVWCMMSSPLLIGCDLESLKSKPETLALLKDKDLVSIDQDTADPHARIVSRLGVSDAFIIARDIGEKYGTDVAMALVNLSDCPVSFAFPIGRGGAIPLEGSISIRHAGRGPDDIYLKPGVYSAFGDERTYIFANIPPHGTRVCFLSGERRVESNGYEGENAFLPEYQELRKPEEAGTAYYAESTEVSGGAYVAGAGGRPGNDVVWNEVWTENGGEYSMSIETVGEGGAISVSVNGEPCTGKTFRLRKGENEIRLSNEKEKMPGIDRIILSKIDAAEAK